MRTVLMNDWTWVSPKHGHAIGWPASGGDSWRNTSRRLCTSTGGSGSRISGRAVTKFAAFYYNYAAAARACAGVINYEGLLARLASGQRATLNADQQDRHRSPTTGRPTLPSAIASWGYMEHDHVQDAGVYRASVDRHCEQEWKSAAELLVRGRMGRFPMKFAIRYWRLVAG